MENCSDDYLTKLPDELKIAIFTHLSSFEILQLADVSQHFEHLTFDKDLIRKICLYQEYRFNVPRLQSFLLNKFRRDTITSLNVSSVYWISAVEFRKCLDKLQMLECFYALDTKMGCCLKDCIAYNGLKHLKSIALTITDHDLQTEDLHYFPLTITSLYLHTDISKYVSKLVHIITKLKLLRELWIIDVGHICYSSITMQVMYVLPDSIEKFSVMIHRLPDVALISYIGSKERMTFKQCRGPTQMCFETNTAIVNAIYASWKCEDVLWDTLINRLRIDPPFCIKDVKKLIHGQSTVEELQFEELNLSHTSSLCSKLLKATLGSLLTTSNMKFLKKLSINFCLCEQGDTEVAKNELVPENEPLFKRIRVGMSSSLSHKSVLERIVENSPLLEELELWECKSTDGNLSNVTNAALSSLQHLTRLKKLTLDGIPLHISGQFLVDICKGCRSLTSLRIQVTQQNNHLNNYLCLALPHATAIKDIRYEQPYIPIDRIIEALNKAENPNMERLMLKCHTIEKFTVAPFEEFLHRNTNLRFLCIIITASVPKTVMRKISMTANNYKTGPEKVFVVGHDESVYFFNRLPVPYIHRIEMLKCNTAVSILDIFNGFEGY